MTIIRSFDNLTPVVIKPIFIVDLLYIGFEKFILLSIELRIGKK